MPDVRPGRVEDHQWVIDTARDVLGGDYQVHSQRQFHVTDQELLIAENGGEPAGFLAWEVDGSWCEVLAIAVIDRRRGIGSALMTSVEQCAVERGCQRMRLVTTDDNIGAQTFYEHLGYALAERLVGAVDECRQLYKPTIPADIHDELRYERIVRGNRQDS